MKNAKPAPLEGCKETGLDSGMKDNPGANVVPDMAASKGPDKPNMKEGYSRGELNYGETSDKTVIGYSHVF